MAVSFLRRFFSNAAGVGGALVQRLGIAVSDDYADEATHPTITSGTGAPTSTAEPAGSIYIRVSTTVGIYQYRSSAWVLVVGMGSDFGATGLKTDVVAESTATAGVTVDGVLLKDNSVTVGTAGQVVTDTIAEKTGAAGVTIDGTLIKDGVVSANLTGNVTGNTSGTAGGLLAAAVFLSGELTGNGASQDTAHGFAATPKLVFVVPSDLTGGVFVVAYGTHDATNAKTTVTTGEKYRVVAFK